MTEEGEHGCEIAESIPPTPGLQSTGRRRPAPHPLMKDGLTEARDLSGQDEVRSTRIHILSWQRGFDGQHHLRQPDAPLLLCPARHHRMFRAPKHGRGGGIRPPIALANLRMRHGR